MRGPGLWLSTPLPALHCSPARERCEYSRQKGRKIDENTRSGLRTKTSGTSETMASSF